MIIGQEMAEIRHGGGMRYGPIFGVCAVWPVFWRLRAGQKSCNTCELQYLWLVACFTWAGGTSHASRGLEEFFFQLCCCVVSVFGAGGKKVLIYIRMYYLEYNTVVVVC
jgi:hypothetical protein